MGSRVLEEIPRKEINIYANFAIQTFLIKIPLQLHTYKYVHCYNIYIEMF